VVHSNGNFKNYSAIKRREEVEDYDIKWKPTTQCTVLVPLQTVRHRSETKLPVGSKTSPLGGTDREDRGTDKKDRVRIPRTNATTTYAMHNNAQ
jgi:hypothetical protein